MHVIAHSSTQAPSSASSRHCAASSFGPARSSVAWVTSTGRGASVLAHDRVVLGRAHVTGREHGAVLPHEREHLERLGEQRVVGVGDDEARAGDAELRGDAVVEVLPARQRRKPDDLGARVAARPRPRRGSRRRPRGRNRCRRTRRCRRRSRWTAHASEAVGKSCDLSTSARWPAAAASRAASNASTERARCGSGPKWQCRSAAPLRSTLTRARCRARATGRRATGGDADRRSRRVRAACAVRRSARRRRCARTGRGSGR